MENRIKISKEHESTRSPFWIIIDPKQNFKKDSDGIYNVASMITGVFFSRESAQGFLDMARHHFSRYAKVYCHSGCYSDEWEEAIKEQSFRDIFSEMKKDPLMYFRKRESEMRFDLETLQDEVEKRNREFGKKKVAETDPDEIEKYHDFLSVKSMIFARLKKKLRRIESILLFIKYEV